MEKIGEYICGESCVPLVVYGQRGNGKTLVMAGAAVRIREKFPLQKTIVIMRFIQITPQATDIRNTLKSICEQVGRKQRERERERERGELHIFFAAHYSSWGRCWPHSWRFPIHKHSLSDSSLQGHPQ